MLATDAELPIEMEEGRAKKGREVNKQTHSIMTRFLSLTSVLVGAALTIAAGSDTPAPAPQHGEANLQPPNATQATSPQAIFPQGIPSTIAL